MTTVSIEDALPDYDSEKFKIYHGKKVLKMYEWLSARVEELEGV